MSSPRISVIIPCYNRFSLVGETIDNMLRQTLPPYEVIVVDDGSTDNSVAVIKSFGGRVRLIQQPNGGPGSARNAGLAAATGQFIQFMDSDDLASLNKLEVQARAIIAKDAEMAYGPWIHLALNGRHVRWIDHVLQRRAVPSWLPLHEWHLRGWSLVLQNCLFTRVFLGKLGPLKPDLFVGEDTEFLNRAFLANPKIVFTPDCMVFYRLHDSGKLSGNGTTKTQKLDHLARTLTYISANLQRARFSMSIATNFLLTYQAWRLWREMVATNAFRPEQVQSIRRIGNAFPAMAYHAYAVWNRVFSAVRRRVTGSPWIPAYCAGRAGAIELLRMREAGLFLDASADYGISIARIEAPIRT